MFIKKSVKTTAVVALIMAGPLFTGCSSSSSGSSSLSFSGTLSNNSLRSLARDFELQTGTASSVSCATADNPPTVVSGAVGGNGAFSVDLSSVAGDGLTCSVLDSGNTVLGTFLYENSNEKSFGGGSQKTDTVAFSESKNVGSVSVSGGQISVDAAAVGVSTTGASLTAAEAFDPSGKWTIGNVNFTLPPGFIGPCPQGSQNCHGPQAGESIFIKRVIGKKFTPDSACQTLADAGTFTSSNTCSGTTGTDDAFVLSIWMSENTFKACGDGTKGALGFNEAQAKAYGHIDFSGDSSILHQAFTYSSSYDVGNPPVTHTITEGWKDNQATSSWPLMNCFSVTSGGQTAYKCLDGAGHYSLSIGGGCTDASGNPVQPDDWSHVNWGQSSNCTNSPVIFDGKTLNSNSCSVPYTPNGGSPTTLTCGGTWGAFNVAGDTVYVGSFSPETLLAQGAACSTLVTGGNPGKELQKLQCYANSFWQNAQSAPETACLRQIRTDWSAATPADFLLNDGPGRPMNMALTEKATYLSSDVVTFTQYEDDFRGVQVQDANGSSWLSCRTKAKSTITVSKIDETHLVIKFVQETSLADSKTACVAAAADESSAQELGIGEMRMLFRMTKI